MNFTRMKNSERLRRVALFFSCVLPLAIERAVEMRAGAMTHAMKKNSAKIASDLNIERPRTGAR